MFSSFLSLFFCLPFVCQLHFNLIFVLFLFFIPLLVCVFCYNTQFVSLVFIAFHFVFRFPRLVCCCSGGVGLAPPPPPPLPPLPCLFHLLNSLLFSFCIIFPSFSLLPYLHSTASPSSSSSSSSSLPSLPSSPLPKHKLRCLVLRLLSLFTASSPTPHSSGITTSPIEPACVYPPPPPPPPPQCY